MEQDPEDRGPEPAGERAEAGEARVAEAGVVDSVPAQEEVASAPVAGRRWLTNWARRVMNRHVPSAVLR